LSAILPLQAIPCLQRWLLSAAALPSLYRSGWLLQPPPANLVEFSCIWVDNIKWVCCALQL